MAIESTAINDLISGLQRQPLQRDSSDWLFGERDDATEIDAGNEDKATTPFDRSTPPVVPLPRSFVNQPTPALDALYRSPSPTTHVRTVNATNIAKKLLLPIGVLSIVIVVLGVYLAKRETKPAAAAAAPEQVAQAEPPAPAPAPATTPVVAPSEEPKPEATAEAPAPAAEPEAKSIDVAPLVVEAKPGDKPQEPMAPADVKAVEVKAVEVKAVEVKAVEVKAVEEPKPVEPQVVIEPGSPASRFLNTAPSQPTIPTVQSKPKPAPAPTAVPDLPPPPKLVEAKPAEPTVAAKPVAATPIAKATPKPAKVAKKSAAQLSAEKRAAAKAAAKASIAASKMRAKKQVASASDDEEEESDEAEEAPAKKAEPKPAAKPSGKGVLSIASTPAMEVWVDGRNSGAQTPVRIILLAGTHKVTLFDKANAKTKTFEIEIRPDETTKVVKNYE